MGWLSLGLCGLEAEKNECLCPAEKQGAVRGSGGGGEEGKQRWGCASSVGCHHHGRAWGNERDAAWGEVRQRAVSSGLGRERGCSGAVWGVSNVLEMGNDGEEEVVRETWERKNKDSRFQSFLSCNVEDSAHSQGFCFRSSSQSTSKVL